MCSAAPASGACPSLAAALQGVTHAKLFLAGEGVREEELEALEDLVDKAAALGICVVLPWKKAYGVVGTRPGPKQL